MDKVLAKIGTDLGETFCVVISKSGGTKETRNGMLEAEAAYERAGLNFAATPSPSPALVSELDKYAIGNGWLERFPDVGLGRRPHQRTLSRRPASCRSPRI